MRSGGGFNNNPNAVQIRPAYKRLLIRHAIQRSINGNCLLLDNCSILFGGTNKRNDADAIITNTNEFNDNPLMTLTMIIISNNFLWKNMLLI